MCHCYNARFSVLKSSFVAVVLKRTNRASVDVTQEANRKTEMDSSESDVLGNMPKTTNKANIQIILQLVFIDFRSTF